MLTLPLLQFASDGNEHGMSEAREALAEQFQLTDTEKIALLPSGRQAVFGNRVAWAKVYLQRAALLDSARSLPNHGTGARRLARFTGAYHCKVSRAFPRVPVDDEEGGG